MSHRLELKKYLGRCPVPWKNFIQTLTHDGEDGVSEETLADALKSYNANYVNLYGNGVPYVEFAHESDLLVFTLKYSN